MAQLPWFERLDCRLYCRTAASTVWGYEDMDQERKEDGKAGADRREFLATAGKFAVVVPPAMSMLLSTTMASPAIAASSGGQKGNNGVGNGYDPQPPGDPPHNDTDPGMGPGNPDRQGGG